MLTKTSQWLQERASDTPTKGLLWEDWCCHGLKVRRSTPLFKDVASLVSGHRKTLFVYTLNPTPLTLTRHWNMYPSTFSTLQPECCAFIINPEPEI